MRRIFTISIDVDLYIKLKQLSKKIDKPMSRIIEDALILELKKGKEEVE